MNVIKYKLDKMRRKIETEDLGTTNRASFVCTMCAKTFTDLEVDQLVDMTSGILRCSYCGAEVEEEGSDRKKDSRSTLVKFNDQFRRLFDLLSKVLVDAMYIVHLLLLFLPKGVLGWDLFRRS